MALTELSVTPFAAGEDLSLCVTIDAAGVYAYHGLTPSASTPGKVVKVRVSDNVAVATLTLPAGFFTPRSILIDDAAGYMYVACSATPIRIAKVELASFTFINSLTFPTGVNICVSAAIDTASGHSYWGDNSSPAKLVKVLNGAGAAAPTQVFSTMLSVNFNLARSIFLHGGFLYVGITYSTTSTRIQRYDVSGASAVFNNTLNFAGVLNLGYTAAVDTANGIGYFVTSTVPAQILKVNLAAFPALISTLVLPAGYNNAFECEIDVARNVLYVLLTGTTPPRVVTVNLTDFATVEFVNLSTAASNSIDYSATADIIIANDYTVPAKSAKLGFPPLTTGAISDTMPSANGVITGSVEQPTIAVAISDTMPAPDGSIAGTVEQPVIAGSISDTMPSANGSITGFAEAAPVPTTGTISDTMPAPVGSITGALAAAQFFETFFLRAYDSAGNKQALQSVKLEAFNSAGLQWDFVGKQFLPPNGYFAALTEIGVSNVGGYSSIFEVSAWNGEISLHAWYVSTEDGKTVNYDLSAEYASGQRLTPTALLNAVGAISLDAAPIVAAIFGKIIGGKSFEKAISCGLAEWAGSAHTVNGAQMFYTPDGIPQFTAQSDGAGGRTNAIL